MENVLLITVDSLRFDYLGCYMQGESHPDFSPNIDKFARDSVVFTNSYTQSIHTSPSFLSILSGEYASKYGDWFGSVSDERMFISEILREQNYYTGGFNSNPYVSKSLGFSKGFDVFEDNLRIISGSGRFKKKAMVFNSKIRNFLLYPYETARKINKQVLSWFSRAKEPWFLWIHYMDVHGPYVTKKGWGIKNRLEGSYLWYKALKEPDKITPSQRQNLIDWYIEEIHALDGYIYDILEALPKNRTVVILTADHGDAFYEHGTYGHPVNSEREVLYNEVIRVPFIIRFPDQYSIEAGRFDAPVRHIDIVPSLLDFLSISSTRDFDGRSFIPFLKGEGEWNPGPIFTEYSRKNVSVILDDWKLILNDRLDRKELYDLCNDSDETKNLATYHPELVKEMTELIREHQIRNQPDKSPPHQEIDEEIKIKLRALGYF